jgi:ubiquinone/menaquinone biosynthesis C-methylase UbiE
MKASDLNQVANRQDLMSEYDAFARFYDLEYQRFTDDLEFYRQLADDAGSPILELACGTGRVLLHLARSGHTVTGLDISPPMLAIARERLAAEPADVRARVTIVEQDMRRFRIDGRFRLAILAINSFMHLMTTQEQEHCLKSIRRPLVDGGLLVIDIFNPDLALYDSAGRTFFERSMDDDVSGSNVTKLVTSQIDRVRRVNHITFYYDETAPGQPQVRHTAAISQHYLYYDEMTGLLNRCGFDVEKVYGGFGPSAWTPASQKMIFVARRKPTPQAAKQSSGGGTSSST